MSGSGCATRAAAITPLSATSRSPTRWSCGPAASCASAASRRGCRWPRPRPPRRSPNERWRDRRHARRRRRAGWHSRCLPRQGAGARAAGRRLRRPDEADSRLLEGQADPAGFWRRRPALLSQGRRAGRPAALPADRQGRDVRRLEGPLCRARRALCHGARGHRSRIPGRRLLGGLPVGPRQRPGTQPCRPPRGPGPGPRGAAPFRRARQLRRHRLQARRPRGVCRPAGLRRWRRHLGGRGGDRHLRCQGRGRGPDGDLLVLSRQQDAARLEGVGGRLLRRLRGQRQHPLLPAERAGGGGHRRRQARVSGDSHRSPGPGGPTQRDDPSGVRQGAGDRLYRRRPAQDAARLVRHRDGGRGAQGAHPHGGQPVPREPPAQPLSGRRPAEPGLLRDRRLRRRPGRLPRGQAPGQHQVRAARRRAGGAGDPAAAGRQGGDRCRDRGDRAGCDPAPPVRSVGQTDDRSGPPAESLDAGRVEGEDAAAAAQC